MSATAASVKAVVGNIAAFDWLPPSIIAVDKAVWGRDLGDEADEPMTDEMPDDVPPLAEGAADGAHEDDTDEATVDTANDANPELVATVDVSKDM